MTTDNTRELDEILHDLADGEAAEEAWTDAKQALIDWNNKQIESELKSIYGELGHIKAVRECIDARLAERNKLKEVK